jgi:glycosyltransferase involved in cell wall biosynthesis
VGILAENGEGEMRILLTADPEIPVPPTLYGGIERMVDMLAGGLRSAGHAVALMAHPESSVDVDERFAWPVIRSQGWKAAIQNSKALKAAADVFKPDVIHSFSRLLFLTSLLRRRTPKVMSYQRPPTFRTVSIAQFLAGRSLFFSGCNEFICRLGRKAGGRWKTIPNGVDLRKFTFRDKVAADAPLLFLSRIERIKGAHTAIAVARRLHRRLVIAGNFSEEGDAGRYWRETIQPEIGHNGIEYVGALDDVQKNKWLGEAAALLVPIEWEEPFGIVFAEALACGTPVISCPRGALPEIVRHGVDGFLAPDVAGLCDGVSHLKQIERARCRERAERFFSMRVIVDAYTQLYREAGAS